MSQIHLKLVPHISSRCLAKEAGVLLGLVLTATSQTNSVCINQGLCMILNKLLMQEEMAATKYAWLNHVSTAVHKRWVAVYLNSHVNTQVVQTGENIQWLAPLRHLPLFFYHQTYNCDLIINFDYGIKIRTLERIMGIYFWNFL